MEATTEINGSNPTIHQHNYNSNNNNNNNNSNKQHNGNSNPKIVISSSSSSTATLNDNVNGNNSNNVSNSLNTNININNNNNSCNSNNNNHITLDSLDQHQQLISIPETGGAAIFLENDHNSLSTSATENTQFVAIPLSERPPIICISQQQHQHQHNHHHQQDNYSQSLTGSASCLLRLRRCCVKLFSKIMGSNNPSEVDRYEYYDCKYTKTIIWVIIFKKPDHAHLHFMGCE
ncbi:uncharacterized protein isoform X2 [Musca autumnalis]|uniref:uncharacterized protein isoform X2 n=1 Tax=Musca autumnalis TaxID=221902 RepID=UPI003CED329A